MPELPDVELYVDKIRERVAGHRLTGVRLHSPFLLRSVAPPLDAAAGRTVVGVRRLGKRIVLSLEDGPFLVVHLMIAGRFQWRDRTGAAIPGGIGLAAFDLDRGTLLLTEASKKRRASLHVVADEATLLAEHDPGGLEPLDCSAAQLAAALTRENHTLKRALTDPRLLSGIGNAYSDEILHRARLSPLALTRHLDGAELARLHRAVQDTLAGWTARLREACGDGFPARVTAFRDGMAAHGRYGKPCPDCGTAIQRIRYAEHEANYCPRCQTGGKVLADRSLSRLLKKDWPRTVEALERMSERRDQGRR